MNSGHGSNEESLKPTQSLKTRRIIVPTAKADDSLEATPSPRQRERPKKSQASNTPSGSSLAVRSIIVGQAANTARAGGGRVNARHENKGGREHARQVNGARGMSARSVERNDIRRAGRTVERLRAKLNSKLFLALAGGVFVLVLLASFWRGASGGKCPGAVRIVKAGAGASKNNSVSLRVEAENYSCVGRVVYQLNGIEVGVKETAPFEIILDRDLVVDSSQKKIHDLLVLVEDARGNTISRPEKLSLSFGTDDKPSELMPEASQTPTAPPPARQLEGSVNVSELAEQLTIQISRKRVPRFPPEFIEIIKAHMEEYRDTGVVERASRHRREINKAFRDVGIDPLIGYLIAMSRGKFDLDAKDAGAGLWRLPVEVARSHGYLRQGESDSALEDPKRAAEIAATYSKTLLNTFDDQDFIYAVACFGSSIKEAGRVQAQLIADAPEHASRRDVLKMIDKGIISREQGDRIARFYAAGIIGENPHSFGLKGVQPLSSLYN
jgi:hypothetical protein